MWAIISTSNTLKFYSFQTKEFSQHLDLNFTINEIGGSTGEVKDHNFVVSKLLSMGFPIFVHKKEAREHATREKLTGFKYLKLNPTILV